jgi:hypothetical protein
MSLVSRVQGILLAPRKEWSVIDNESATPASLYSGYVVPLAAIPAIAGFIGSSIFGYNLLGSTIRISVAAGIEGALVRYIMSLIGVYVLALIIDALAPNFGGTKNPIQALKVSAYSHTASWVAGIFAIIPGLGVLGILGLYSLYLLFVGLPVLMKAPEDKSLGYTAVVILCAIVLFAIVAAITSRFVGYGMMQP